MCRFTYPILGESMRLYSIKVLAENRDVTGENDRRCHVLVERYHSAHLFRLLFVLLTTLPFTPMWYIVPCIVVFLLYRCYILLLNIKVSLSNPFDQSNWLISRTAIRSSGLGTSFRASIAPRDAVWLRIEFHLAP